MSYENFAYYYDSLMDQRFYDDYLQFILAHASFSHVLELGCGTGEMAVRLAKLNKKILATDLSDEMLEVARMKAMYHDVDIDFRKVDMCDFEADDIFDLVLCLCDSLNYVLEKESVYQVFANAFNSLIDQGVFIFDVNSLYKMNVILKDYLEENDDPDYYFKWHVEKVDDGFVKHTVIINDKNENDHVVEEHFQKTWSIETYKSLLEDAGFNDIEIYSDFHDYVNECERVIFICRKGGKV